MATLSNTELSKYRNGEYRWLKFQRKMNAGEPFILSPQGRKIFGKNSTVIKPVDTYMFVRNIYESLASGGDFSRMAGTKFKDVETGVILGLTALEKTEEFGKSGGLGGGTHQTYYIEKRTAIECAKKVGGYCDRGTDFASGIGPGWYDYYISGIEEHQKKDGLDSSWDMSFSETVDAIVYSRETFGMKDYHHSGQLPHWVKDSYRKCKVGTSFATRDINKWNPADIWVSSGSLYDISSSLAACSTLEHLGEVCYSPNLKGISLKKGGTELKVVKSEPKPWKVEKLELLGWEGNQWVAEGSCLRVKFNFEGGPDKLLIVRPDRATFKAEVKTIGSTHRNGSCGLIQLNGILDEFEAGCRFTSLKDVPDKYKKDEARKQLIRFAKYITCDMVADIARHCVCQARGHCTYLKVS